MPLSLRLVPPLRHVSRSPAAIAAGLLALVLGATPAAAQTAIVTHHYDISRDGWNQTETVLTPVNVGTPGPAGTFGLLATVPLDGPIDAQPLVVPNVIVQGDPNPGTHDVVYVATQNNSVYAIDPTRGTILKQVNFGTLVAQERGCSHIDVGVGITGTPVIDLKRQLMYVVAYTHDLVGSKYKPEYHLHALDLSTLEDKIPPVLISAEATLTDGSTLIFNGAIERQRPALLEFRNKVYVTFGTFCDGARARGWVMGYGADTLKPVDPDAAGPPYALLTNRLATSPASRFITGIWMSEGGLTADQNGIYYVTGNSDPSGTSYDPVNNAEHSVVRLSLDTTTILDRFTPSNLVYLDQHDLDFGSGGVMLIPKLGPGEPPMAAATGKFGTLYLLNRTDLGGFTAGGPDKVLDTATVGPCWCGPSYFNDGTPTLVSSAGNQVVLFALQSKPSPTLVQRAVSPALKTGLDPGFWTSVSSNGTSDTIVWAVTRPIEPKGPGVWLYAFGVGAPGTPLTSLYVGAAGTWASYAHDPNMVPVVANGRVYVANDSGLEVFGLAPAGN